MNSKTVIWKDHVDDEIYHIGVYNQFAGHTSVHHWMSLCEDAIYDLFGRDVLNNLDNIGLGMLYEIKLKLALGDSLL